MREKLFVERLRAAVMHAAPAFTTKAQQMVVAHAAFETGWGEGRAFILGNNAFNITRTTHDQRAVVMGGDLEYGADGKAKKIVQRFAKYDTVEDSVAHYLVFIDRARYQPSMTFLREGDVEGFLGALSKGGYFTLPLARYVQGFLVVLRQVEGAWPVEPICA